MLTKEGVEKEKLFESYEKLDPPHMKILHVDEAP
jgi:hypothetical protein